MEFVTALAPFLVMGFFAALLSRFTGLSSTMMLTPAVLYMGATPVETVSFMLTFILYNNFTMETQDLRLSLKEFTFFPGWRIAIPVVLTVAASVVVPFLALAFFITCFILEMGAAIYKRMKPQDQPPVREIVSNALLSALFCVIGVLLITFIPENLYYIAAGLGILVILGFAWYAGQHRDAFRGTWQRIWNALHLLLGLFGVEGAIYARGLKRSFSSKVDYLMPLITVAAGFAGLLALFLVYNVFSIPSLVAAVGSAIAVRLFGVYEFNNRGGFSYVAIGLGILVVLCLYLVQPVPTGFGYLDHLFNQAIK